MGKFEKKKPSQSLARARATNFDIAEERLLVRLVLDRRDILESNVSDANTNDAKQKAWIALEKEFNASQVREVSVIFFFVFVLSVLLFVLCKFMCTDSLCTKICCGLAAKIQKYKERLAQSSRVCEARDVRHWRWKSSHRSVVYAGRPRFHGINWFD